MALWAQEGVEAQPSLPALPAHTTTTTPRFTALSTDLDTWPEQSPDSRLIEAIFGLTF